jgi:hypothetical protein
MVLVITTPPHSTTPRLKKKDTINLGGQFAILEANVPAFINILMSMF